jgi:hypothetical protein
MPLHIKRKFKKEKDYRVGYKSPPRHSQFKKGLSGNPDGRPKGDKNSMSILKEILSKEIDVKKNGYPARVNMLTAIWLQLVNNAVKGNLKAVGMVLSQISLLEMKDAEKAVVMAALTKEDQFILDNFAERNKEKINGQK